ncbi:MCE-family protein MCE3D [Mycobacterium tuberculosis]|nr:MCE-family protein MCE3D [Mycobacterium tuberculosis]CLW37483.1 MCE-family protein MCE3D [Mycobacterium tuberculosis]CLW55261.1 MCE-family protein MCE3D [Mycobacterium tuberculosis]
MTTKLRRARSVLATALVLVAGVILAMRTADAAARTTVVAYFDNSNGVFAGDDVLIRGVPVGKIVKIEPQPLRAKISFWFDRKYRVPADAAAAILSPQLVTGRAIQLTPPYAGGPTMADGTVIPQERTVVPVEWDDLRAQLQRLTALLQPTRPGGVSTLGALINTAADNLRGQGATIRDTIIKLSQAISALGDHSKDIFSTVTNLSTLVTALHDSADLLERLNHNLAAVTSLLADGPDKIGQAAEDLNAVVADVGSFAAEHREAIGTASDKLASITTALVDSLDDIKQTLHISPTVLQNFNNIFEPANGALTGALAGNNMANPIAFLCGAIQAASRLGGEQAAKLCVQYLAPIVKNRQYNYPPLGANLFVGAQARPNEVTYSEDWLRPDYVAPVADTPPDPAAAVTVDPATGLRGMMMPPGVAREDRPDPGDDRGRGSELRLARAEFAAAARHAGQRPGVLRGPGAAAGCQQHPAELAGAGCRRDGRPRHENRAPRLARVGDHAAGWRRRFARQRNGQDRHHQPAGFLPHRAGATERRSAARQAARRFTHCAVTR